MKLFYVFLLTLLFSGNTFAQTCLSDGIIFYTQEEIDAFAANYPGCTEILGDVSIESSSINNLNGLSQLTTVGGDFIMSGIASENLSGLENLTSVAGTLSVWSCYALTDLTAFSNLTTIGGTLEIYNNNVLTSLAGFEGITTIPISLEIQNNQLLPNLTGLDNISYIDRNLWIEDNPNLVSLTGLEGLEVVDGFFVAISGNDALQDLNGLNNLTTIDAPLRVVDNNSLVSLEGLKSLTSVSFMEISANFSLSSLEGLNNLSDVGSVFINSNAALLNLNGLESVETLGGLELRFNSSLVDFSGLDNLESIQGYFEVYRSDSLRNFNGLGSLNSIGNYFDVRRNDALEDFEGLDNLTTIGNYFWVERNDSLRTLNGLESLESVGDYLSLEYNRSLEAISGLSSLNTIGSDFRMQGSLPLINLNGLQNLTTVGERFWIEYCPSLIDFTGLENLTFIGDMFVINNNDGLVSFQGLNNLEEAGRTRIHTNNALTTTAGLSSLQIVDGAIEIHNNPLLERIEGMYELNDVWNFHVSNNEILSDITDLENLQTLERISIWENPMLVSIDAFNNVSTELDIVSLKDNPNLMVCNVPAICNHLLDGGGYTTIENNASGCSSGAEILFTCAELGKVQNNVFYDLNQNQIQDNDEQEYIGAAFSVQPLEGVYFPNSSNTFYLDSGTYIVTYDEAENPDWILTTNPPSYTVNIDEGACEILDFGIYPTQQTSDIQPFITSTLMRCNETATLTLTAKNMGTTVANGTLWLTIDDDLTTTNFSIPPDVVMNNTFGWNFSDLYPSQIIDYEINVDVPGPPDFSIGSLLHFYTHVEFTDANGAQISPTFHYAPEVRCSWDPNDKLVNPSREGGYTLFDEDIIYTVRFQNTGNDVAYDVVIRDTLDANLDHSTFHLLGSSHTEVLNTNLNDTGVLTFEFRDIFLPDSTSNLAGSQGYVTYMIRANEGLAENTPITNSAGIYFDHNPPVITNTTESIMVSELPTVSVISSNELPDYFIFPNPNDGKFEIRGINEGRYKITDISGRVIQIGDIKNDSSIDISNQAQGVYFIAINSPNNTFTSKIIKHK